jgi:hypothetical protein
MYIYLTQHTGFAALFMQDLRSYSLRKVFVGVRGHTSSSSSSDVENKAQSSQLVFLTQRTGSISKGEFARGTQV